MKKLFKKYSYVALLIYLPLMYRLIGEFNLKYQSHRVVNLTSRFDHLFFYSGSFVFIYLSYFLMMLYPLWQKEKTRVMLSMRVFVVSVLAQIIFLAYPARVERFPDLFLAQSGFDKVLLKLIYSFDINNNCFPTLHAAQVIVIAFSLPISKRPIEIIILRLLAFLIAISTVVIKQHTIIDVVGAFILSFGVIQFFSKKEKDIVYE